MSFGFRGLSILKQVGGQSSLPVEVSVLESFNHYWTFDNADTIGSVLLDSAGSLDGNSTNVTTGFSGVLGESYRFNSGLSSRIDLGTDAINPTGDFSVSAWVQPLSAAEQRIISNRRVEIFGTEDGWYFRIGGESPANVRAIGFNLEADTIFDDTNSVDYISLLQTIAARQGWYHMAATWESSTGTKRVYLNRLKVYESTTPGLIGKTFTSNGLSSTWIGSQNSAQDLNGYLDELKFWNGTKLTDEEIFAVYDQVVDNYSFPTPTGYFSCDSEDIVGSTLIDSIGATNGTIVGAVSQITGISNGGLNFTTGNDYVNLGFGPWDFTSSFSVSVWYQNWTGGTSNKRLLQNRGTGSFGTQAGWILRLPNGQNVQFAVDDGAGNSLSATTATIVDDFTWNHLVGTWDSTTGTKRLYLNGVCIQQEINASLIGVNLTSGRESTIGISKVGGTLSQDFNGYMDEIAWWDGTVLNGENVMKIYQYGRKKFRLDS